jgi:hypothetical protein
MAGGGSASGNWPLETGNCPSKSKSPVVFDLPGFGLHLDAFLMLLFQDIERKNRRQGSPLSCIQQQQQLHAQQGFPGYIVSVISFGRP